MSWSKVIRRFSFVDETEPVGSQEYVQQVQDLRRAQSPERQQRDQLAADKTAAKQAAYAEGAVAGEKRGLAQAAAEVSRLKAVLQSTVTDVERFRQDFYREAETRILDLAFALADKVTGTRSEREQALVLDAIRKCIAEILDVGKIKLRVNPDQLEFVRDSLDLVKQQNDAVNHVVVEADSRVDIGGCIVDTDSGSADGRLTSQLAMLRRELVELQS